jgi:hypothetical protein
LREEAVANEPFPIPLNCHDQTKLWAQLSPTSQMKSRKQPREQRFSDEMRKILRVICRQFVHESSGIVNLNVVANSEVSSFSPVSVFSSSHHTVQYITVVGSRINKLIQQFVNVRLISRFNGDCEDLSD